MPAPARVPAPAPAPDAPSGAPLLDLAWLDRDLAAAEAELRELKREVADLDATDRLAAALADVERRVRAVRDRRDRLRSLLPRVLAALEPGSAPAPGTEDDARTSPPASLPFQEPNR